MLTFRAKQRGRTLQEVSDLLQRPSVLPAANAALGVVASGRGGGALRGGDAVALGAEKAQWQEPQPGYIEILSKIVKFNNSNLPKCGTD